VERPLDWTLLPFLCRPVRIRYLKRCAVLFSDETHLGSEEVDAGHPLTIRLLPPPECQYQLLALLFWHVGLAEGKSANISNAYSSMHSIYVRSFWAFPLPMGRCTLFPSIGNDGTGAHYHISTLSLHMLHRPGRLWLTVVRSFEVSLYLFCRCGWRSVVSGDH